MALSENVDSVVSETLEYIPSYMGEGFEVNITPLLPLIRAHPQSTLRKLSCMALSAQVAPFSGLR